MKKIGFNNFRRFKEFESLDLGEITFLVGKNNAGKSTLVKAILLVTDYLKNKQSGIFKFDGNSLDDANVVSFGRTLYNKAESNNISINFTIGDFDCNIIITGNEYDTKAQVLSLDMKSHKDNFEFKFNFSRNTEVNIKRSFDKEIVKDHLILNTEEKLKELRFELDLIDKEENTDAYIKKNTEISILEKKIKNYNTSNSSNTKDYEISYTLPNKKEELESINEIIDSILRRNKAEKNNTTSKKLEYKKAISSLHSDEKLIYTKISNFSNYVSKLDLSYFGADSHKQTGLFSLRDKNNSLSQAIHNFYQLKIDKDDKEYKFVKTWMDDFKIGKDFKIKCYEGEVYSFKILNEEDDIKYINLADIGMGSLQAMKLILRVATVIYKMRHSQTEISSEVIIIEEPELNLHPNLQSLLTLFLYEVNKEYKIKFIIETHSDYIIKHTQVIVRSLNKNNKTSPFKVFFFPKENKPYEMTYDSGGKFIESFEPGFSDISRKLTRKLL